MSGRYRAVVAIAAFQVGGFAAAQDLLWPQSGAFPAYPSVEDARTIRWFLPVEVLYSDNVFALADDEDPLALLGEGSRDDTVASAGAGMKMRVRNSLQAFELDLSGDRVHFDRFDILDHTRYDARGAWRWAVSSRWTGDLGIASRRTLANLADLQFLIKDMVTTNHAFASAAFRATPRWQFRLAADGYDVDNSAEALQALDYRLARGTAAIEFFSRDGNSAGVQYRHTVGEYPNREADVGALVDNRYDERETSLVVDWQVSARSGARLRAGYTDRGYRLASTRDFGGFTGRLEGRYALSPKTALRLAAYRELQSVDELTANYVDVTGARGMLAWAPRSKLVLQFEAGYEEREFAGDPGFVIGADPGRKDDSLVASVALGYAPRDAFRLLLGYDYRERDSATPGVPYSANSGFLRLVGQF